MIICWFGVAWNPTKPQSNQWKQWPELDTLHNCCITLTLGMDLFITYWLGIRSIPPGMYSWVSAIFETSCEPPCWTKVYPAVPAMMIKQIPWWFLSPTRKPQHSLVAFGMKPTETALDPLWRSTFKPMAPKSAQWSRNKVCTSLSQSGLRCKNGCFGALWAELRKGVQHWYLPKIGNSGM